MAISTEERGAFRPAEAARWLGVSRDTVDRLWQTGRLRSFKIGAARFISREALEKFVAELEAEA